MTTKFFFALLLLILWHADLAAQWNGDPKINTVVCDGSLSEGIQESVTDGANGVIFVWMDPNYRLIYTQRLSSAGTTEWSSTAFPVIVYNGNLLNEFVQVNSIMPDGYGGVYISFGKFKNFDDSVTSIFLQRIDHSGQLLFGSNGIQINPANQHATGDVRICADKSGAIVTWIDKIADNNPELAKYATVFAQRYDLKGIPQWDANGIKVSTVQSIQKEVDITTDGNYGAFIAFSDSRNSDFDAYGYPTNMDIYAQHLDSSGTRLWGSQDSIVSTAPYNQQVFKDHLFRSENSMRPDGAGGFIIVYRGDVSAFTFNADLYAQRINGSGTRQFAGNGVALSGTSGQFKSHLHLAEDNTNGVVAMWNEFNGSSLFVHSQRVSGTGSAMWGNDGIIVNPANELDFGRYRAAMVADGKGNYVFTWGISNHDLLMPLVIKVQKVSNAGILQWDPNGIIISANTSSAPTNPGIIRVNADTLVVAWSDRRNEATNGMDTYASKIGPNGKPVNEVIATYTSIANGNWSDPSIWANNSIPTAGSKIIIRNTVLVNVNATCFSVRVESPGIVTVQAGINFSVLH